MIVYSQMSVRGYRKCYCPVKLVVYHYSIVVSGIRYDAVSIAVPIAVSYVTKNAKHMK